ncbi:YdbH domain-containing protein [Alterisphingorhabdus coralli]|uniref:YdbH domain-containing protein n=1 Tax=Alterisphingorhabdus coralli TaxID=3071408 RepID=A0AA97HZX4_9SPHN|nr:YdbH domain-containing protein [Parasphingorhabdus sp. SCSIO 66989]WOE73848.1 YdbH domain-containing protein [Parasphingorhabdus sp. SCSIO 66989]
MPSSRAASLVPESLWVRLLLAGIFIVFAGGFLAWTQRVELADSYAADYLATQGIEAHYDVVDVGVRRQHLRNVIIGSPKAPDLVIEEVIATTRPGFGTLVLEDVRVRGMRLFGRYDDSNTDRPLSFGALDKLIFTDSDAPFELPDFTVDVDDARIRMDTPYGDVGVALSGYGHLKDGFEGELAATAEALDFGSCTIDQPSLFGTIRVASLEPIFSGPLRGTNLNCPDAAAKLESFAFTADARANRTLEELHLGLSGAAESPVYAGLDQGQIVAETLLVDMEAGIDAKVLDMQGEVSLADMRSPWLDGEEVAFSVNSEPLAFADMAQSGAILERLEASAALNAKGLTVDDAWNSVATEAVAETPLEPLWRHIAPLLNAHMSNAGFALSGSVADGVLALDPSVIKRDNGAALARFSGADIALNGTGAADDIPFSARIVDRSLPQLSADILWGGGLANGGLKQIDLSLRRYAANGAALAIEDLRIRQQGRADYALAGTIGLTGPLPDGRVDNLVLPLNGQLRDGSSYYARGGCQKVAFNSLKMATTSIARNGLSLCPVDGKPLLAFDDQGVRFNANSGAVSLKGDLSGTSWAVASEQLILRYPGMTELRDITAQIGEAESATRIAAQSLTLDSNGGELGGEFSEAVATIGEIPLLIDEGQGQWSWGDEGLLLASDHIRVSDREPEYRFNPLFGRDVTLKLVDGRVTADGYLHERETETRVSTVNIVHDLESATGNAVLKVDALRFGPEFQPELITPLTLGLVANVNGQVDGAGEIRWNPDGIESDGRFYTEYADLAAAFGPVKGIAGEIVFSDLLAIETPPGQVVRLGEVNPGVAAYDGVIRYQLLPNQRIALEGGEWPFANGRLIMEPAVFDMAGEEDRRLGFEVIGMDAALFLAQYDFENITATGVFDGKLPIIFNQDGGRIEGGHLTVREGGGTVAYVGQLTYEDMGTVANFAFNSLRSLKYQSLEIDMNGPLDGEMVTQINFAGLSQGDEASRNFITKQIAKLPIQFNVTVRAPFFQLITSARSFYDTQYLPDIRSVTIPSQEPEAAGANTGD